MSQENSNRAGLATVNYNPNQSPAYLNINTSHNSKFSSAQKDQNLERDSACARVLKPSSRNKVILTRSVDADRGGLESILVSTNKAPKVTARMHLNHNTTLELLDPTVPKFQPKNKQLSPFVLKE